MSDLNAQLVGSWIANLCSKHTNANSGSGQRFLATMCVPLRQATIEDVRDALTSITNGLSARQVVLRVKSLVLRSRRTVRSVPKPSA
jgi:hypothetical protein